MWWIVSVPLLLCATSAAATNNVNLKPRQRIPFGEESSELSWRYGGGSDGGGNGSESEHFKLLEQDGQSLLVGARNAVYNLSLPTLRLQKKLSWASTPAEVGDCERKGESARDCQNYIRVLVRAGPGRAIVCGTNAFNPRCRLYAVEPSGDYAVRRELEGTGLCPYNPRHNSTATFIPSSGQIFAATVTDRAASDPLIYRRSLHSLSQHAALPQLRTQRYDLKTLNRPNFIASFPYGDYVYFWFREEAVEAEESGVVYARVARVCRHDKGGPKSHDTYAGSWTTYLKARLNCSLPATYFDRLEAVAGPVASPEGSDFVYALLSTPPNSLQASAVCVFRMSEVAGLMESGAFAGQSRPESRWRPIPHSKVPSPRPGLCTPHSQRLPPAVVKFANLNSLLARPVSNAAPTPLYIDNSMGPILTEIAVDGGVEDVDGNRYDVLYVGTRAGELRKLVRVNEGETVLVEESRVFSAQPIRNLLIYRGEEAATGLGRLVAVSESSVRSLPLAHCDRAKSCAACLYLRDPHCAWDATAGVCVQREGGSWRKGDWVQSIAEGRSSRCPHPHIPIHDYAVNDNYALHSASTVESDGLYSPASMSLAIILTLALALSLGFLLGFRLSGWKKSSGVESSSASSASDYQSHSMGLSRLTRHDAAAKAHSHLYAPPPPPSHARAALLSSAQPNGSLRTATLGRQDFGRASSSLLSASLHVPPGASSNPFASSHDKNNLLSLSNGTLPKDYRVKKVYL